MAELFCYMLEKYTFMQKVNKTIVYKGNNVKCLYCLRWNWSTAVYDKIETSIGKINKKKGKIGCCSSLYVMMKNRTNMLNMQFHVSSSAVEHCWRRWWWWLCSMFSEMENIFYYKFVCVWNPGPSKKKYTLLAIALSLSLLVTTHNRKSCVLWTLNTSFNVKKEHTKKRKKSNCLIDYFVVSAGGHVSYRHVIPCIIIIIIIGFIKTVYENWTRHWLDKYRIYWEMTTTICSLSFTFWSNERCVCVWHTVCIYRRRHKTHSMTTEKWCVWQWCPCCASCSNQWRMKNV